MPDVEHITSKSASSWAATSGLWEFSGADATFRGGTTSDATVASGAALSDLRMSSGWIEIEIEIDNVGESGGAIQFGFDVNSGAHFACGMFGTGRAAYFLDEFVPGQGYKSIFSAGDVRNLKGGTGYRLTVGVVGQSTWLMVDDVVVLSRQISHPLFNDQIGLIAWGAGPVRFRDLRVTTERPQAFVVMQFGDPYDSIYRDVIAPVLNETGFAVVRADNMYGPGVILQDIVNGILRAGIVVAEITPENANVFYELGYAHALGKPTILLAQKATRLPFDVSGYRCVFYDDTIGGKHSVETELRQHLLAIAGSLMTVG